MFPRESFLSYPAGAQIWAEAIGLGPRLPGAVSGNGWIFTFFQSEMGALIGGASSGPGLQVEGVWESECCKFPWTETREAGTFQTQEEGVDGTSAYKSGRSPFPGSEENLVLVGWGWGVPEDEFLQELGEGLPVLTAWGDLSSQNSVSVRGAIHSHLLCSHPDPSVTLSFRGNHTSIFL